MIEPYTFLPIRAITPDTPAHALGLLARLTGFGVEGNSNKPLHPGNSHTKDEVGAKRRSCDGEKDLNGMRQRTLGKEGVWESKEI